MLISRFLSFHVYSLSIIKLYITSNIFLSTKLSLNLYQIHYNMFVYDILSLKTIILSKNSDLINQLNKYHLSIMFLVLN